jgi:hypothetical protein
MSWDNANRTPIRQQSLVPRESLGAARGALYGVPLGLACLALAPFVGWILAAIRYP